MLDDPSIVKHDITIWTKSAPASAIFDLDLPKRKVSQPRPS